MAIITPRMFAVRFACPSDFVFEDRVELQMKDVSGPFGPVKFSFRTKRYANGQVSIPLIIDAEGPCIDEATAIQSLADLGRSFTRAFAIASNAPVREMCLQSEFTLPTAARRRRVLEPEPAFSVLRAFYECPARTWVIRAAREYEMALRCDSDAQSTVRLAHLYRASLNLGHGLIRRLCRLHGCNISELSLNLDMEPDELEGYIYRKLIFAGNDELFQIAYDAHARFCHMEHPENVRFWGQHPALSHSSSSIAAVVRGALFDLAAVPQAMTVRLNSMTYATPSFSVSTDCSQGA